MRPSRWLHTFTENEVAVFRITTEFVDVILFSCYRLTNPDDPLGSPYTLEECGEHREELVVYNQGLHDLILQDVDALLKQGNQTYFVLNIYACRYVTT